MFCDKIWSHRSGGPGTVHFDRYGHRYRKLYDDYYDDDDDRKTLFWSVGVI